MCNAIIHVDDIYKPNSNRAGSSGQQAHDGSREAASSVQVETAMRSMPAARILSEEIPRLQKNCTSQLNTNNYGKCLHL